MLPRRSKYDDITLVSFIDNLLLCSHWSTSFHSLLTMDSIPPSFLSENKRFVSSDENAVCRSLK